MGGGGENSMEIYFCYWIIGFIVALPVDKRTIEMIKQGLKNGFIHGATFSLGSMTINMLLVFFFYLGMMSFLTLTYIQILLWLVGAIFFLYLAYDSIKNAEKDISLASEYIMKSFWGTYKRGLIIAISPKKLILWLVVLSAVLVKVSTVNQFGFASIAILIGGVFHDIVLLLHLSISRHAVNRRRIKAISRVAGILLICFVLYFFYEFIEIIINKIFLPKLTIVSI